MYMMYIIGWLCCKTHHRYAHPLTKHFVVRYYFKNYTFLDYISRHIFLKSNVIHLVKNSIYNYKINESKPKPFLYK